MTTVDLNLAAAEAALALFERMAPEAAVDVAAWLPRLFQAQADGHAFVEVGQNEQRQLAAAAPIVSAAGNTPLVLQGNKLFLGRFWQLEQDLAAELQRLAAGEALMPDEAAVVRGLCDWFADEGSRDQQKAAALALLQPLMLISGGPGTGKTTTVAKLLALLCAGMQPLPRIALAAPTGKAAAHMARALHRALDELAAEPLVLEHLRALEGQTVHRLLKLKPPQMKPVYHREQPLALDVLVVDEASMLDSYLMLQILRAVPNGCRLILLGDENQLPPVGAGALLAEWAQPTVVTPEMARRLAAWLPQTLFEVSDRPLPLAANIARLTISHRFHERSGIGCLARAVVAGEMEEVRAAFTRFGQELACCEEALGVQVAGLYDLHQAYWQAVAKGDVAAVFRHQADAVVLAAWREDAERFNHTYRRHLQQQGHEVPDSGWYAGQIIMITRNDYALEVFNGDIGVVLPDDRDESRLTAVFPAAQGYRRLPLSRLPEHETAYAITVHKSQGSEYKEVWLLPPSAEEQEGSGFSRALLYTAITRAREKFVFWGREQWLEVACRQDQARRSALREMLMRLPSNYDA